MVPGLKKEAKKRQVKSGEQFGRGKNAKVTASRSEPKGEATEHAGNVVGVSGSLVKRARYVAENDPELNIDP